MVRYLMFFSYIGSRYRGAAKQQNQSSLMDLDTIQGALEIALRTAFYPRSKILPFISISSRTDAGVHALCNTAHVELIHPNDEIYNTNYITGKLNVWLAKCGHEIRINTIYPITQEFNSRGSAKSRTYLYRFIIAKDSNEYRVPINELKRSWHVGGENIDIEAAKEATKLFVGRKNYSSFSPQNKSRRKIDYVRELSLTIEPSTPLMPNDPLSDSFNFWHVTVQSRSFVYNQVRRIVGALIALASGRITERDITTMLQVPSYLNWNEKSQMAPPHGLYLKTIEYDKEELAKCIIKQEHATEELSQKLMSQNQ